MKNDYFIKENVVYIHLENKIGETCQTKVDLNSLEILKKIDVKWNPVKWPNSDNIYVQAYNRNKELGSSTLILHRLLTNAPKGVKVDHKNHNTLDNRSENLRLSTSIENGQNREKAQADSKTGIRGIHWDERLKKWIAQATINREKIYLGTFSEILKAQEAVELFRSKYMPFSNECNEQIKEININEVKEFAKQIRNSYKFGKSGIRGIHWHKKTQKWQVAFLVNGKKKYFGLYNTIDEAKKRLEEVTAQM